MTKNVVFFDKNRKKQVASKKSKREDIVKNISTSKLENIPSKKDTKKDKNKSNKKTTKIKPQIKEANEENKNIVKLAENFTVGNHLKNLRLEKNISLEEISENTKIKVKYLEAIENNDIENLPNQIISIGFFNLYCDEIGIDKNTYKKDFQAFLSGNKTDNEKQQNENIKIKSANENISYYFDIDDEQTKQNLKKKVEFVFLSTVSLLIMISLIFWISFHIYKKDNNYSVKIPSRYENNENEGSDASEQKIFYDQSQTEQKNIENVNEIIDDLFKQINETNAPIENEVKENNDKIIMQNIFAQSSEVNPPIMGLGVNNKIDPVYPIQCHKNAKNFEYVTINFRISNTGYVKYFVVNDASNDCFVLSAINSIQRWNFDFSKKLFLKEIYNKEFYVTFSFLKG